MKTLLMRLAAPMQSWGTESRFGFRETNLEPSKSGVIGLLCAALGKRKFDEKGRSVDEDEETPDCPSLKRLTALRMGVRVDLPGVMLVDYHAVGGRHREDEDYGVLKSSGDISKFADISQRFYLADAVFLVGLEARIQEDADKWLPLLQSKLQRPHWQICLGRKAFVPSEPVWLPDGLSPLQLEQALVSYRWLAPEETPTPSEGLQAVIETDETDAPTSVARMDVPLSFAARKFTIRYVKTTWLVPEKGAEFDAA